MRKHQKLWYLDTACSNHISGDKLVFTDLYESYQNFVKFGDESKVSIMEKGMLAIQTKKNTVQTISDIFFVLELKTSLLDIG